MTYDLTTNWRGAASPHRREGYASEQQQQPPALARGLRGERGRHAGTVGASDCVGIEATRRRSGHPLPGRVPFRRGGPVPCPTCTGGADGALLHGACRGATVRPGHLRQDRDGVPQDHDVRLRLGRLAGHPGTLPHRYHGGPYGTDRYRGHARGARSRRAWDDRHARRELPRDALVARAGACRTRATAGMPRRAVLFPRRRSEGFRDGYRRRTIPPRPCGNATGSTTSCPRTASMGSTTLASKGSGVTQSVQCPWWTVREPATRSWRERSTASLAVEW